MLVLTLSLRSARTGREEVLGEASICNRGNLPPGDRKGDYDIVVTRRGISLCSTMAGNHKPLRTGKFLNFPRKSYSVWRLVIRLLLEAFPEEKKRL